jgi:hypothetical protein
VFPVLLNNHGNTQPAQHIKKLLKLSWTSILFIIYFPFSPFIPQTQSIISKWHYAQIWRHSDMKWLKHQVLNSSGHNVKCRNLTFVKNLKTCAIVKLCQQIGDTPSDTYEKIKLTQNNKSAIRILFFSLRKQIKNC